MYTALNFLANNIIISAGKFYLEILGKRNCPNRTKFGVVEGEGKDVYATDVLSCLTNFPHLDNVGKKFACRILS